MRKNRIIKKAESGFSFRTLLILLSTAILMSSVLYGCSETSVDPAKPQTKDKPDKLSIVTTIFPPYDFARQVAGDNADITMLLAPGEECHTFEPSPQDIIDIQNADLFIYVGGESEEWVDGILSSIDNKNMKILNMMDITDVVEEEIVEGMEDHEDDEASSNAETNDVGEDKEYDEHIWTSIDNAQVITHAICEALCELDEPHQAVYTNACEIYLSELSSLKKDINKIVKNGKRNTIVFGDRFPIRYFADEFDLKYYAAFPGCAEQSEPSAGTVAFLIEKVKKENIPVVFYLELSNGKIAKTIADSTSAETMQFNSCHNVTMDQFLDGVTYVDLMRENLAALEKALN